MTADSLINQLETVEFTNYETSILRSSSCGISHVGMVRHVNEDAYLELTDQSLWVVADGMGGYKRGDFASTTITRSLQSFRHQNSLQEIIADLEKRLIEANDVCQNAFQKKRVGSTVVALLEHANHCFFIWAGDSRVYRLRNGNLQQMTLDHTLAQEKIDRGELDPKEAETHTSAHILTRAVGVHRSLKLELRGSSCEPGDRYLLCSDGLYGEVGPIDMLNLLSQDDQIGAAEELIQLALHKGARDNVTAVVVDMHQNNPQ